MKKHLLPAAIAMASGTLSLSAYAAPFNSLDARSMAMGDVGVAASKSGSAPIFNPALLSQNPDDIVSIILPNVGASAYADEDAIDSFQNIEDEEYFDTIEDSVDIFNNSSNINEAQGAAADLGNATKGLNEELGNLDEKPFNINAGALFSVAVPTELIGIGVYANAQAVIETAPIITDCDQQLFDDYAEISLFLSENYDPANPPTIDPDLATSTCTKPDGTEWDRTIYDTTQNEFVDPTDPVLGPYNTYLTSNVAVAGVTITEFGVALSHKFDVNGTKFSLGITPKMQEITSYYALPSVDDLDDDDYDLGDELEDNEKTEDVFNIDLGFSMGFLHDESLVVGLTLKNLIGDTYETKAVSFDHDYDPNTPDIEVNAEFDLEPQARAGVSWDLPLGFTVASDLDLTTNKALFNGQDTQYFGVGAEWDIISIVRLRAGARTNLEESDDTAFTAGLGFNIIAFHIDLAGQYSDNNAGAALQMGVEF